MPQQGEQEKLTELTKLTKLRAICPENEENEEEAYWEGGELRKHTPYFPDSVYKNMPILLEEAISENGLATRVPFYTFREEPRWNDSL
ncbi:MAG: hypothetical protein LBN29_04235 [Mediterranea sp.]|jgi:hypothetical protein|nr:hypothetical protein [Mediterranea sp.]